jgi:hypothetical protein
MTSDGAYRDRTGGTDATRALRSRSVPPVSFFFTDRRLSVSEDAAASLVAELQNRPESSQTAGSLAERIETEAHRGRLAAPGQDLELSYDEQRSSWKR